MIATEHPTTHLVQWRGQTIQVFPPRVRAVYLLHSETKLCNHAQHYCGFTNDLASRIARHFHGNSSKLVQAWTRNGIRFVVARVWLDEGRDWERYIKQQKNGPRYCPICQGKVHVGYSIDIHEVLFEKAPPQLGAHSGKRRPMKS